MRLAAQAKAGFYPIDPRAMVLVQEHLRVEKPKSVTMLDPCAGEGAAITLLSDRLDVPRDRVYMVELNVARANLIRQTYADVNVLGPASFHSIRCTPNTFSLIYCNPPFDDEFGGGQREERAFLDRACQLLVEDGILVMVMPVGTFNGSYKFIQLRGVIDNWLEDACAWKLPAYMRPFREVVVIGRRRKTPLIDDNDSYRHVANAGLWRKFGDKYDGYEPDEIFGRLSDLGSAPYMGRKLNEWTREYTLEYAEKSVLFDVPPGHKPRSWAKDSFTDEELYEAVEKSPLRKLLEAKKEYQWGRPPMPLNEGHVGLCLVSGLLDGVVRSPGLPTHVVRGSTRKEVAKEPSQVDVSETDDGTRIKRHYPQYQITVIRAVDHAARIVTLLGGAQTPGSNTEDLDA